LGLWIVASVLLAGAATTFVSPEMLGGWSSSVWTMLVIVAIGVPMYVCDTSSTPLAAGMLIAGLSPGAVLVFLLAGPATNLASLGIVRRELGTPIMVAYVTSVAGSAIGLGLLTDWLVGVMNISVQAQALEVAEFVPHGLAVASLVVLVLLGIRPLRRRVIGA
ncbi:MAG: permease, partial [Phycisphaeraceae bacterium]